MPNGAERSTRIAVDLQACQTAGSARRGVGRYSSSLAQAMRAADGAHDVFAVAWDHHPIRPELSNFPQARLLNLPELPDWPLTGPGQLRDNLDSILYASSIASLRTDVVHMSSLFEGFGGRAPMPSVAGRTSGQLFSATLYDLIPLRFPEHYFASKPLEGWYRERLAWLMQMDLLLAISESSRQDAIDLLGIEPSRIVTIHGGISAHFVPTIDKAAARRHLATQYGINRDRFFLYGGGDDFRKNLPGAIKGYAAVPLHQRSDTQLVIVCALEAHRRDMYRAMCRKEGLSDGDVVFTGHVSDADLVSLYGTCDLFIFPSLYEGLGLPVLEAMACGAPVIGGDNSSIRELIERQDALFDASEPSAVGNAISKLMSTPSLMQELREHGAGVAKKFNWKATAERALAAIDEALERKRRGGIEAATQGWLPRSRLAFLSPLPPSWTGIADYNAEFLPHLARHFEIDLFVAEPPVSDATLNATFGIFDIRDFAANAQQYDAILYEFGNSEFHVHMLSLLKAFPGVVGLHDGFLSGMAAYMDFRLGEKDYFPSEMLKSHGSKARAVLAPLKEHRDPVGECVVNLPCTKGVLDDAIGVISHSPFNLQLAREFYPEGWSAPYRTIPQMIKVPIAWPKDKIEAAGRDLGFAPGDFIVATFGHVAWTKWGDRLLDAFLKSSLAQDEHCKLIFVGELAKDHFGDQLEKMIRSAGLGKRIRVTGFVSRDDYERYLRITDLAFQLRGNSRGGTPRGALDCLAYGTPLVLNNDASYRDYPDDAIYKLSPNPDVNEIAVALDELRSNASMRERLSAAGPRYTREFHDPELCAKQYALAIHEFTGRQKALDSRSYATALAPYLSATEDPTEASELAARYLDNRPRVTFDRPRLIIDCSYTSRGEAKTGIGRVVSQTVVAGYCRDLPGLDTIAVRRDGDALVEANDWLAEQKLLLPHEIAQPPAKVEFRSGDCLLSWIPPGTTTRPSETYSSVQELPAFRSSPPSMICCL